jgi:MFS family permease
MIGIILGLNGLVALVSLPLAGKMADKWGRPPMLVAMYLISSLRMLLYSVASTPLAYVPVQILHFGSFGIAEAVGSVYISELADERDRATALSCFHIFHSIGALIGSIVGGVISSSYGFPVMYQAFAGLMVVSASIFAVTQSGKILVAKES